MAEVARQGYAPIDLVAVNLYPFRETVAAPGVTLREAMESVDIGGPHADPRRRQEPPRRVGRGGPGGLRGRAGGGCERD